jgi:stage II sporulation protein D
MSRYKTIFAAIVLLVGSCFVLSRDPSHMETSAVREDTRLQAIATAALGNREGAIVVVDPQTGHVLAVVNPKLAFESAFPPGSTIKPFMTLALMRAGVITGNTRMRCRHRYKRTDVVDSCSHPRDLAPFNPSEALAYSCNYYFATLGERLEEDHVSRILADFGFEQIARGRWQPESAVGEGGFLQVTPMQLAMAYAALFNGDKVLTDERAILLAGMRGAVTFGTAEKAELDSLSTFVVGKTGTSTPLQGFRPQGWFVGVAFPSQTKTAPGDAQLVVVVYLKNAHGSEAAELTRSIFAGFSGAPSSKTSSTYVTVKQVSENITRRMPLEDYVRQVVAGEASVEDEPEALKALAIAARTYALKNLGRHQQDGYDFCSTTHCQRFATVEARPSVASAIKETAGLVLQDGRDRMADVYYSASCGGMTANLKTIWGAEDAPEYLHGVRDSYCNSGSHYRWTDVISSKNLADALRSDPRTDVGETVRDISVAKYDQTGRAEVVSIVGDRTRTINGWEFKLIVGRALGWQLLKSSRFNVSRSGSEFVFRGSGFGHGLGLCQEGSHVMAQRGQSFQQILAHYFPGTSVGQYRENAKPSLRSSHFRLLYPKTIDEREAEQVLSLLEANRTELLRRISAAGIQSAFPDLEIVINETTGDFTGRTGMPSWAAAATKNNRVELQPLKLLKQRRILETTLRHELVHVLVDAVGNAQTPRWLTEGMAIYVAGEGKMIAQRQPTSVEEVEHALASARSAGDMQTAYAGAYNLVRRLIQSDGEQNVWRRIANRSYSQLMLFVYTKAQKR